MTTAEVDDKLRLQRVETWFDPLEMFRQMMPRGDVEGEENTADELQVAVQVDLEDGEGEATTETRQARLTDDPQQGTLFAGTDQSHTPGHHHQTAQRQHRKSKPHNPLDPWTNFLNISGSSCPFLDGSK